MRKLLLIPALIGFIACSETSTDTAAEAENTEVEEVEVTAEIRSYLAYGDSIETKGALNPDAFLAKMEGEDTLQVTLAATINETCRVKGCWMTLDMENGDELRVRFKDYGFFVPLEGVDGKKAIIAGKAFTDTLSVEYLRHLAEDAEKSEEEIAAITEPEISVNFEATGVVIEE